MNWKRIIVFVLLFPIVIPVLILVGFVHLFILLINGVEYIIFGDINNTE